MAANGSRARNFTDTTLAWFEAGDMLGEAPASDVYDEPPPIPSVVVHAVVLAVFCGAGALGLWFVL